MPGDRMQAVVRQGGAVAEGHAAGGRIHRRGFGLYHAHAFRCDRAIGEALGGDIAQPDEHLVAERAGGELRIGLDQDDVQPRIGAAEEPGSGGAAEAAAHHDDTRRRLRARNERCEQEGRCGFKQEAAARCPLPPTPSRKGRGSGVRCAGHPPPPLAGAGRGEGSQATYSHFGPTSHTAIATLSSWEKPLAIRSITVAGLVPARNASSATTISARSRPVNTGSGATPP